MGLTILINAVFRKNSNFSLEAKEMAGNWKTRKINWETRNNIKINIPHIACNFSCKKETNGGKIYTNSYFHKWENVQNFQGDLHHYSTWYSIIALVTPRLIRFLKWFWNSKEAVKADWKSHTETGLHDCGKACPSNLQKDQKQRLTFSFLFTPPSRIIYWASFISIPSVEVFTCHHLVPELMKNHSVTFWLLSQFETIAGVGIQFAVWKIIYQHWENDFAV